MATDVDARWHQTLTELDWWVAQHGDARVPQHARTRVVDGKPFALGNRVRYLRERYLAGELEQDRIRDLEARPGWTWQPQQAHFDTRISELQAWVAQHGNLTGLPTALSQWLLIQRRRADAGELTPAQARQLKQLPRRQGLDQFIDAATTWLARHRGQDLSHVKYRDTITIDGEIYPLGKRITYYRRRRAGLEGTHPLTENETARLTQLPGWSWGTSTAAADEESTH